MFKKILIANRGEIAVRIIRACNELGITACTIHTKNETTSPHVYLADESYLIDSVIPVDAYLDIKSIVQIAKNENVEAVHPGYGFLSENYLFIDALKKESIVFIGPDAVTVEMMGNKVQARKIVSDLGLPVIPGSIKPCRTVDEVKSIASEIDFPIMLKASAGGGGKGMRIVEYENEIENSFNAASSEALKAFGDGSMYVEKFLKVPRHIEVQILGDNHGNYVHLLERECSIQRRHQKIIEEAPANISEDLRTKLFEAALKIAKAAKYKNAGTIEFLVEGNEYYFLEMNTRLQVEHPVTESITDVDIVKEQFKIASNEVLSIKQPDIVARGHSIECRINSEDPFNNFFPSIGKINYLSLPAGKGIRIDSGIRQDSIISPDFDPLIAKVISHGKNRNEAIEKIIIALKNFKVSGVLTNIPFHLQIIDVEEFRNSEYSIKFLEQNKDDILKKINSGVIDHQHIAAVIGASIRTRNERLQVQKNVKTTWGDCE